MASTPVTSEELNHLIWFFSLTKKEKDVLNSLSNNIKGGMDWMALRGPSEVAVTTAPIAALKAEVAKPVARKKGRGRPRKS